MHNAHAAGRAASSGPNLVSEIGALANLLYRGAPESQAAHRSGVQWHPAGVLLEQLVADLTVVYSPPKVGSTTIAATLSAHPAVRPEATHLHYLSDEGLATLERAIATCSHPNVQFFQFHLAQCRAVRALLAANRALRAGGLGATVRKPYLVAGVREPVALNLSLAFEGWWTFAERPEDLTAEHVRARAGESSRNDCDSWFATELEPVFGINVFDSPFPTDRGWDLYENETARLLVIRQENLDRLPDALGALYGLDPSTFVVNNANVAEHKAYANHYAALKRVLRLTEPELDRAYGARYVRHFYAEAEIAAFRRRWSANRPDTPSTPTTPKSAPKARPEPAGAPAPAPHPWGCRPCWRCQAQLSSIPGLQHTCAAQSAQIDQLEAARRAAQAPRPGLLRALAKRLPKPLRTLAKRVVRFGR